MQAELEALTSVFDAPRSPTARPVFAVIGGAEVSTKIALLRNRAPSATCSARARSMIAAASASGCEIVLPIDAVVA